MPCTLSFRFLAQQVVRGVLITARTNDSLLTLIRTRNYTIAPLAEKGLISAKPAAKQKALDCILLYVETDKADPVVEELLPLLSHKLPKIIAATLSAFKAIYHAYGCKTVDPKPVLKTLPKVFGHADKNVRAEAQALTVELFRWLRDGMKPLFWNDLKPVQQQDLEKLFEKVKDEPSPRPERLLRSQQVTQAATVPEGAMEDGGEVDGNGEGESDFAPEVMAVDVFPKIPKDFSERLASSKWKDRKDALDDLHAAINFPAIEDGPFDDIIRGLAKSMKDANVAVVTVAANCVELLATGLRGKFSKYRSTVFSSTMERLKERKQTVTDALAGALDAVCSATSIADCLEEALGFLSNKNPQIKLESTKFLSRAFKTSREAPTIPEVKQVAEATLKLLTDSQETQRNAACEVLGVLLKIMGERVMNVHLNDLDDIRKAKIKEYADTTEVKAKYKPKPSGPTPKTTSAAPQKKPAGKKPVPATSTPRAAKKPSSAAPPAPGLEEDIPPTPQPKPNARSGIARPGAAGTGPRGLKPPSTGSAPATRKLVTPSAGVPGAPMSPGQTSQPPVSPPLQEHTPAPKVSRGLAGRTLTKPIPHEATSTSTTATSTTQPHPSIERIELDELHAEVTRLRNTSETYRADHLRLTSQINELQNQNAQLIEDHTRDVLLIKAKETQLVRARSDAETAEQQVSSLQREVERLKRELGRIGRAASPRTSDLATAADIFPSEQLGTGGAVGPDGPGHWSRVMSPAFGAGKENAAPDSSVTNKSLNRVASNTSDIRKDSASPRRAAAVSRPLNQAPPPYSAHASSANGHGTSFGSSHSGAGVQGMSDSDAPSSATSSASITRGDGRRLGTATTGDRGAGMQGGVETWKRAAEVTQNLKARIELMKARQQQQQSLQRH